MIIVTAAIIHNPPSKAIPAAVEGCKYQVPWSTGGGVPTYKCMSEKEYQSYIEKQDKKAEEDQKAAFNFLKQFWWAIVVLGIILFLLVFK